MSETGMIQRRGFVVRIAGLVAVGVTGGRLWAQLPGGTSPTPITVYKSSTCDCCTKWVDHIRANGFSPVVHDQEEMDALKDEMGVPPDVRSCHTAIVDKYLIEGHVPASDIRRLLADRPKTLGLAVPGMPPLTPGMAPAGVKPKDFEVISFQPDGSTKVFARH
ncbi:MAG: DUF411 domain-containing protein [Gemmatimonadales bacterium]|nr:DUF411 domain-containing protein [Gemmatimonadales bacterium]